MTKNLLTSSQARAQRRRVAARKQEAANVKTYRIPPRFYDDHRSRTRTGRSSTRRFRASPDRQRPPSKHYGSKDLPMATNRTKLWLWRYGLSVGRYGGRCFYIGIPLVGASRTNKAAAARGWRWVGWVV